MGTHQKSRSCSVLPAPKLFVQEDNLDAAEQDHAHFKAHRQKRNSKSATLLKKLMNSSAQIPFKARRRNQPNQQAFPSTPQQCDASGSDDDVSSFVASRSNSVMSIAPVLCPPIPAEQRTRQSVSAKGSLSSPPPVAAARPSGKSYTRHAHAVSELPPLYLRPSNLSTLMSTLPDPEIVPWSGAELNEEDEEEDEVRALMTPSHPSDDGRYPYDEDLQFNSALSVLDSSRYGTPQGTLQDSIDTVNTDFSDLQDDMSGWSMHSRSDTKSSSKSALRNNSSGSSLILSGEVCFCPKEGIITLEPNQKQQKASFKAHPTHTSTMRSFSKNSMNDDQIKKKKAHLWGHLFKRKETLHHWAETDKEQRIVSN